LEVVEDCFVAAGRLEECSGWAVGYAQVVTLAICEERHESKVPPTSSPSSVHGPTKIRFGSCRVGSLSSFSCAFMMSKKSAKSQKEQSTYEYRDIVLAKVRGYPPWPGMVCHLHASRPSMTFLASCSQVVDPDSVPSTVSKERPGSKKTSFYCVRFFPAGD
jgi:PWWP domain